MAIWQYQIFVVPEEEVKSYFENDVFVNYGAFNEINWWKYRQIDMECFGVFNSILPSRKSWSDFIILFGEESSNCVEVLIEKSNIVEVSAKIDLRYDFKIFVAALSKFARKNNCLFLNHDLKIIDSSLRAIEEDISNYSVYSSFLKKIKK